MTTIRGRLTLWYTLALGFAVLAFGAALYVERWQSLGRELDQRLGLEVDFADKWLTRSHEVLSRIVTPGPRPALVQSVGLYFEGLRDYLIVADRRGNLLYASETARQLNYAALVHLLAQVAPTPAARRAGTITIEPGADPVRYVVTPVSTGDPDVAAILVATPFTAVAFGPSELLNSMLFTAPLILGAAAVLGWWLAGQALEPVQGMIDELAAITDGRSLHRRLAVPMAGDELARLTITVNGMIARLEQSFAALRRFTADASHELKTPLMVLRAGVERALTHPGTPQESLEALDETLNQVNQMSETIDSLLTLARADEGRLDLATEPLDLAELVRDAGETAGMLGEAAGIGVTIEVPAEPVVLPLDRGRIRQMLLNLITNAIKYTGRGGRVAIALEASGQAISLTVRDTGIGIAPGDLPHIFDRFWRADLVRTRTGDRPGTGLGLAITKWIVDAHGGTIHVQSRPGRGTVFTVAFTRPPEP